MMERPVNITRQPRADDALAERQEVPASELEETAEAESDPDIGAEFTTSGTSRDDWARDRAKGWNLKRIDDEPIL